MIKKILIVVFAILILLGGGAYFWYKDIRNNLMLSENEIKEHWTNIEKEYKNFTKIVPDLSPIIIDYVKNDQQLLDEVTETHKRIDGMTINVDKFDKQEMKQYIQSQDEYVDLVNHLLFRVRVYPDLNAEENFKEIQTRLNAAEENILSSKIKYNEIVGKYNTSITEFPNYIIADAAGLKGKPYFQAEN